jgi:hypothetical protein
MGPRLFQCTNSFWARHGLIANLCFAIYAGSVSLPSHDKSAYRHLGFAEFPHDDKSVSQDLASL